METHVKTTSTVGDFNESASAFERLRTFHLEPWAVTCLRLLEHLSGLEEVIAEPTERPIEAIRHAVNTALADEDGAAPDRLLEALSTLPVFRHCAGATTEHGQSVRWNPLAEPLSRFQRRYGDRVTFWEDWTPYPSPADVRTWLKAQHGSD
jgi:hypothetical protein